MDRNYYYEKMTKQREREISQDLANRNLLKDTKREPLTTKQAGKLVLWLAPVAIVLTILLLSFLI